MREMRIVMPLAAHVPNHLQVHVEMETKFALLAGGCTAYRGTGSWVDDDTAPSQLIREEVVIYDVAVEDDDAMVARVAGAAVDAGKALRQKAVYIRMPGGEVIVEHVPTAKELERPLGTKRVPEPGEVWKMRDGRIVAVIRVVRDDAYPMQCREIVTGADVYLTDDGRAHHDRTVSDLDLVSFVSRWRD